MKKLCSHCHQPLPEMRAGVRLSPLKAHIFDVVKRAHSNGITIEDINTICFDGQASAVNVRNHIHQINDALAGTDFEIRRIPSDELTRLVYVLKEIRACLESETLINIQQRLALLSRDMDNHNGQRVLHQPTFTGR